MGISLLTIVLEWDDKKKRYVETKRYVNPNLKQDIKELEKKYLGKKLK